MLNSTKLYLQPVQVLCFFLIALASVANLACLSDDDLTAEEHLEKAFEFGQLQLVNEVEAHALKAAALGSVCAEMLLANLYQPNDMIVHTKDGNARRADGGWIGVDERKALDWSKRLEASLISLSEQGNETAMFYLGLGHLDIRGFSMSHLLPNDSLSYEWLEKAALAGHEHSIRFLMMNDLVRENPDRKEALLNGLAEKGNGEAYRRLSLMHLGGKDSTPNPEQYFATIRQAIDSGITGVYAWAKGDLEALEKQAAIGNEASIRYLEIADSLDIRSRLESLPDAGAQVKDPRDSVSKESFCQGLP